MIGIYDYTVWLTYLSLLSASAGIFVSLSGDGRPFLGAFFLLFSGLCDAFDGKVASMKKDRTDLGRRFGIQIDSLSDLVAFGILPASIGASLFRSSDYFGELFEIGDKSWYCVLLKTLMFAILLIYILAALIRLAFYNVTEEERQKTETGRRLFYTGLPVTSAALVFPVILLVIHLVSVDLTVLYFAVMLFMAAAFLLKIQIRKPGIRGVLLMVGIGAAEFLTIVLLRYLFRIM